MTDDLYRRRARAHTVRRLRERYPFRLRRRFYDHLVEAILQERSAWLIYRQSARTTHWAVRAMARQSVWIYCVFNEPVGCIRTVLPPHALAAWAALLPADQQASLQRFLADLR